MDVLDGWVEVQVKRCRYDVGMSGFMDEGMDGWMDGCRYGYWHGCSFVLNMNSNNIYLD